jgi:pimeloyl-ACP methyl ester carboxylesterase
MYSSSHRQILLTTLLAFSFAAPLFASAAASDATPAQHTAPPVQTTTQQWRTVPTQFINAGGVQFAYRELGKENGGTPVIFLNHLAAVLDNWDPRVVDGLAAKHHVFVFDNRGVGASSGSSPETLEEMADDAIQFIQALGYPQVDLFGFSMGGMISQEIALKQPQLVRKMILAGTGPAGSEGISNVAGVANVDLVHGLLTGQDPKQFLFFTRTPAGIEAGQAFLRRLQERSEQRDQEISLSAYTAQLRALKRWGQKASANLSVIQQPVFVVNGDSDRMVPSSNSYELAQRLPHSTLTIYPDAGHGGIFQNHAAFVPQALEFLAR